MRKCKGALLLISGAGIRSKSSRDRNVGALTSAIRNHNILQNFGDPAQRTLNAYGQLQAAREQRKHVQIKLHLLITFLAKSGHRKLHQKARIQPARFVENLTAKISVFCKTPTLFSHTKSAKSKRDSSGGFVYLFI
jgi:hypothetical protein